MNNRLIYCAIITLGYAVLSGAAPKQPIDMVLVKGGTFKMGLKGGDDEKPVHTVELSSFYISRTEVTQKQWQAVMGDNPSKYKGDNRPVENVSWFDCVEFCNKLSRKEGLTPAYKISGKKVTWNKKANGYRLPTEAEWEYAARGGQKSRGYTYAGSYNSDEVGWTGGVDGNSDEKTHPVGRKKANELGIYDMSGNVSEWCWDWYGKSYYSKSPRRNPTGPSSGSTRVCRGGSWYSSASRSAFRSRNGPSDRSINLGLRLVRR